VIELPYLVPYAVPAFVLLILLEMALWRLRGSARFETRDAAASLAMGLGNTVAGATLGFVALGAYQWVHRFALFDLGYAWWAFVLCFALEDMAYYWFHRTSHERRWFWASHVVHHSSQHYNLTTALRQTWTGTLGLTFLFWLPLPLLGFEPAMVVFFQGVSLIYQFWIHTETIGSMGPLGWVFNTPSHHRVHHATNPRYLDANYAGVLIVWDRLFGSFVPERSDDKPRYGIVRNIGTFNPLKIAFHEWWGMIRDLSRARSLTEAAGYVFGPPGWKPGGRGRTTAAIKAEWRMRGAAPAPAE